MPVNTDVAKAKKRLGNLITKCRGNDMSLRQLAIKVGLSPSNMKYIEDGINCPTADVYSRLISVLTPSPKKHKEMDRAYMTIRNAPPPDVCDRVKSDPYLINIIRAMDENPLTEFQAKEIMKLLNSYKEENNKGDTENG